jgi:ketosteroid isomerase-like protein
MSEENLELIQRIYDAYARRDNAAPFELYAPDIEWDISELGDIPIARVYRGHDGVRASFRDLFSAFRDFEIRPEALRDAGNRVLATVSEQGVGGVSGAVVNRRHYAVWTLRDGTVERMRVYLDRSDAERAAGLAS